MKKSILFCALIGFFTYVPGISYAQTPDWLWAKSASGTSLDYASSVATDAIGNVYVTGKFSGITITFGTTTLTNSGEYDIFLVKYDANGNVLWATSAGSTLSEGACSVATDASGNAYVAGYFDGPAITFGTTTLLNSCSDHSEIFLVKYDANGDVLWAKSASGTGCDVAYSVATDASGNACVTGCFDSPNITFGTTTLLNSSFSFFNIFLVKYDANGNVQWATSAGGINDEVSSSLALDAIGNAYVTGTFCSPAVTFDTTTLTNTYSGYSDIFLVKYDANGNVQWAKSASGTVRDIAYSVATDASGNAYMTGDFNSPAITFDTTTLLNAFSGFSDIFLVKYDANGNVLWAKSATGTGVGNAFSVATDASGNAYVAGYFDGPAITFGTTTLTNSISDYSDIFLVKYDTTGNVLWAKSATGIGGDYANSVATDASGNAYVTGYFDSPTFTFGTTTITNSGIFDIFLAKVTNSVKINELNNQEYFSVFPNPAKDKIVIEIPDVTEECNLTIVNIEGHRLLQQIITEPTTTIDVGTLPSGVYLVKVAGEKRVQVGKFVKQ